MRIYAVTFLTSFIIFGSAFASPVPENPLPEQLQKIQKDYTKTRDNAKLDLGLAKDETLKARIQDKLDFFNRRLDCFNQKEDINVRVCLLEEEFQMANDGNCYAQFSLGNRYETEAKNYEQAKKWYLAEANNPRCHEPQTRKQEIANWEKSHAQSPTDLQAVTAVISTIKKAKAQAEKPDPSEMMDGGSSPVRKRLIEFADEQLNCFKKEMAQENENDLLKYTYCTMKSTKKSAEANNFIGQMNLGDLYRDELKNNEMAIFWYKKSLDNPETTKEYKEKISEKLKKLTTE